MGIVRRFEDRLEQLVSGVFAKAFRSAVQPVELAAALQREVDNSAQILSRERRLVPNTFHLELSQTDYERLAPYSHTLAAELTDMLREHADEQRYVFAGPVSMDFARAEDLGTGRFRVKSRAQAKVVTEVTHGEGAVRQATAFLEVNGTRHPLVPPGLVIGRGSGADLRINDPGISRRHAQVRVSLEGRHLGVTVVDLDSTNGVQVDGRTVVEAALSDGSVVRIGNTDLTAHLGAGG